MQTNFNSSPQSYAHYPQKDQWFVHSICPQVVNNKLISNIMLENDEVWVIY